MYKLFGRIFSSQPQPSKDQEKSDPPENIPEEGDESSDHMARINGMKNGDASEGESAVLNGNAFDSSRFREGVEIEIRPDAPKSDKKSKKDRKKGKKAAKKQDIVYPELPDDVNGEVAPEESVMPGPISNGTIDGETTAAELPKQGKKSKKSKGTSKRRTRAMPASEILPNSNLVVAEDEAEEEEDVIISLNKSRLSKYKPMLTTDLRRSRSIQSASAKPEDIVNNIYTAVPDLTPHIPNFRDIYEVPEDDEDSATILHKPMTPAQTLHVRTGSHIHEQNVAARVLLQKDMKSLAHPSTVHVDVDEQQKKLSKKALGKRTASEAAVVIESSKKRKRKDKASAGTPKLHMFGFSSDESVTSKSSKEKSISIPRLSQKDLTSTARRLYAEAENESDTSPPPAAKPTTPSTILPRQQLLTQWTPINPQNRAKVSTQPTEPSLEIKSPELIVPSSVPKSNERKKRRLPTGGFESSSVKADKPRTKKLTSKPAKAEKSTSRPRASMTVKGSRLSREDFQAITDIVETWRDENDLAESEMNDLIQRAVDTESKRFWDHLSEKFSDFPRLKLQQACRRKFHNFERGPFTPAEDDKLRKLHEKYAGKWKQIGQTMNRFPEDCRDRWRNYLICGDNLKKDQWSKEEEDNLRIAVDECIEMIKEGRQRAGESKDPLVDDETLIDWQAVSEKMGRTRSRLQCSVKWKSLKERMESDVVDLTAEAPISETTWRLEEAERKARLMTPKQKLALLYAIRDSEAGIEGKIPWVRIQRDDLHVKKQRMSLKVCFRVLKRQVPGYEDFKLQEIVEYLIDAYEATAPLEPKGFKKAFESTQLRAVSHALSETPKNRKRIFEGDSDSDDNSEGPSTMKKSMPARTPKSSKTQVAEESEPKDMETSRPTKAKKARKKSKGKRAAMIDEMENENVPSPAPKPKKKKTLHTRMKPLAEQISQKTDEEPDSVPVIDGFASSFDTIKTGRVRKSLHGSENTSKSKSPFLSKEFVSESEDEQSEEQECHVIEESQPEEENNSINDEQESVASADEGFPGRGVPAVEDDSSVNEEEGENLNQNDDQESVISADEDLTARGGPVKDDISINEEEDEHTPTHTRASVDLDAEDDGDEHVITLNGFHAPNGRKQEDDYDEEDDSEEEEFRGRSPSKKAGTPLAYDNDKTPKANEYTNDVAGSRESSVALSSSMGSMEDIPAVPRRSQVQREISAEL